MGKKRINIYVSEEIAQRLELAAKPHGGKTKGEIATEALSIFLSREIDDQRDAAIIKRLDQINRILMRIEDQLRIDTETLALFILYYLTLTDPIPQEHKQIAERKGRQRYARFLEQVALRVRSGRSLTANVIQEITPDEEEFFTPADFEGEAAL